MYKILKYISFAFIVSIATTSCSKQLDLYPASAIELTQSFQSMSDAASWDRGNYARFRGLQYGTYSFFADIQSDMLNASTDYGNRNGNPHRWDGSFLSDDGTLRGIWSGYYGVLANANLAIANLPNIKTTNPADAALITRYIANARFTRAFCYSELVKRFAKAYNPASATTDLGVPLVLQYNVNLKPARATMKAVYDQILADIDYAKTNLATVPGTVGSSVFNINVVRSLEARVALNMQNWSIAHQIAESVINTNVYPLVTSQALFLSMWRTDLANEVIYRPLVSAPNELPSTNNIYLGFNQALNRFQPDFIPSAWVIDSFETSDIRKQTYFQQLNLTLTGTNYNNVWLVNKYPGNPALFTSAVTNYAHQPKVFRVAELYLISAEAGSRSGNAAELAAGTARYNQLRAARGVSIFAGGDFVQAVRNERFREMAFEGERLWDLKRWNLPCVRKSPQNLVLIQTTPANVFHELNIASNNDKYTWGIPSWDMIANENLVQNPGW